MVRHYFLAIGLTVFLGCQSELPVEYYISSSCLGNPDEVEAIKAGADAWSKATCMEVFRYMGVYNDDWFTIEEDLQDGIRVVYCLDDYENPDVNEIEHWSPVEFAAYSIADIFVQRNAVADTTYSRKVNVYHQPADGRITPQEYLKAFKAIMTHEFGHKIGFSHNADARGYSVMNPSFASEMTPDAPALLDIEGSNEVDGFCDWYDCPPADTCPTKPTF